MRKTIATFEILQERFNPPLDRTRVFLTSSLMDELGIGDGKTVHFMVGSKSRRLQVERLTFEPDGLSFIFRLLPSNALFFRLKSGQRYWISYNNDSNVLRVLRVVHGK